MSDYENDPEEKLSLTDPEGNVLQEQKAAYVPCLVCNAACTYTTNDWANCYGEIIIHDGLHVCAFHEKHGSPEAWYESIDTDTESPFPREVGSSEKELSNHGGEFSDQENLGEVDNGNIREVEDPHYVDGTKR